MLHYVAVCCNMLQMVIFRLCTYVANGDKICSNVVQIISVLLCGT